jgi:hypothetical protein
MNGSPDSSDSARDDPGFTPAVREHAAVGDFEAAVREYRSATGAGVDEARAAIKRLMELEGRSERLIEGCLTGCTPSFLVAALLLYLAGALLWRFVGGLLF